MKAIILLIAAAIFAYQPLPAFAQRTQREFLTDSVSQAKPVKAGGKIVVGGFYFESGRAEIGANLKKYLKNVSVELKKIKFQKLFVDGYADNSGGNSTNNILSRKRAEAVKRELVKNGIPAKKIQARAYGSSKPIASNNTRSGRIQNRRVEILIR
jgi:outer membrane protein OmpA-like peptidoglycan-associated protein